MDDESYFRGDVMTDLLRSCGDVLVEAGFSTRLVEIPEVQGKTPFEALAFEDATVLGFVVLYENPQQLIESWKAHGERLAISHRASLQAARQKAWNTYLVLLSIEPADFSQSQLLGQIEEDLKAMRKITKAGVTDGSGARLALLPLLPFRAAPSLDPIEMRQEIQLRSTELDDDVVAAFLSKAEEGVVMQLLEDRA